MVVVGGGVAGLYFAYRLLRAVEARVTLVDRGDRHEFTLGIPLAIAGLVDFDSLVTPFSALTRLAYVRAEAAAVEGRCVRTRGGPPEVCGDRLVLAPGSMKLGSAGYWTVEGARALLRRAAAAKAVRFVVSDESPLLGFQDVAYSLKAAFPRKEVSIHLAYMGDDYRPLLEPARRWLEEAGVAVEDGPPPRKAEGELHVSVPAVRLHPLAAPLEVDPATFETQFERVYLIGHSSLMKLGLPPVDWGSLWQAATLAEAIAGEISGGVFEVEADSWLRPGDGEAFYRRLTRGLEAEGDAPLSRLKALHERWREVLDGLR